MAKYLIDVNLPRFFSLWNTPEYAFVANIDDEMKDSEVWAYAMEHSMTIVSKDADFRELILASEPPPRFIHIKLGNMKMAEFHTKLSSLWDDVCDMSDRYKLVVVYPDRIEGIG